VHGATKLLAFAAVALVAGSCSSSSKASGGSTSPTSARASATSTGEPSTSAAPPQATGLPDVNQHFTASGSLTSSAPGITPTEIKIGYITSQTGIAASSFKGGDVGAIARIDLQNAQGGVDGRKLVLVSADDGTIGPKAAAQQLVQNQGVFGVMDISAFVVVAAPYFQQQGVPVTGAGIDGPEWGQQPYSNMFEFGPPSYTPFSGKFYAYDDTGRFLKSIGVTKLASLAYGISASSIQSSKSTIQASAPYGISNCYENNSVQFGQSAFTTEALAIQKNGCDGVVSGMVDASDVGLSASLKQAGVTAKQLYYTGYDQGVLEDSNASAALDGAYFPASPNFTDPPTGIQQMLNALHTYAPSLQGIPSFGVWGSYMAADVMIEGLEAAGANPTRQSFITSLRAVSNYDGHGLFAQGPLSFTGFGTVAMFSPQMCTDYVELKGGKFVTVAKNICGKLVATTS